MKHKFWNDTSTGIDLHSNFLDLQLWLLAVLQPLKLKGCIVAHLEVLIKEQLNFASKVLWKQYVIFSKRKLIHIHSTYLQKNGVFFETVSLDNLDNKCLILVYGQKNSVTKWPKTKFSLTYQIFQSFWWWRKSKPFFSAEA